MIPINELEKALNRFKKADQSLKTLMEYYELANPQFKNDVAALIESLEVLLSARRQNSNISPGIKRLKSYTVKEDE